MLLIKSWISGRSTRCVRDADPKVNDLTTAFDFEHDDD
jgi:hypothetical protein